MSRSISALVRPGSPKFLFLHIPKNGGTAIRNAYMTHVRRRHDLRIEPFGWHHWSARYAQQQVGLDYWREATRFCVIRSPYARMISLYNHFMVRKHGAPDTREAFRDWVLGSERDDPVLECGLPIRAAQYGYMESDSGCPIYVVRFEDLEKQVDELFGVCLPWRRMNESKYALPFDDYFDRETEAFVEDRYARDFEILREV